MKIWTKMVMTVMAAAGIAASGWGLDVVLVNGWRFTGTVRMDAKTVFVKQGSVTRTIPRGSVVEIRLDAAEHGEYERRQATVGPTAQDAFALGAWLTGKLQHEEAEKWYEKTLALDANHKGAHEALGYHLEDGKWVRSDETRWQMQSQWIGQAGSEACYELAKLRHDKGEEKAVEPLLRRALMAWAENPEALKMMRPITDQYVSKNKYRLPLAGLWAVIHDASGHHGKIAYMVYCTDMVRLDEEKRRTVKGERPRTVEDVYTWGSPVYAAADGVVTSVKDDFDDMPLGDEGKFMLANMVCIEHAFGESTVYGHLEKGSAVVKAGQKVKAGDMIARAGNSGSAGFPHLHWGMYDRDGIGLPMTFAGLVEVTRDGERAVEDGRLREGHVYRGVQKTESGK